jgi:hypothetical protein
MPNEPKNQNDLYEIAEVPFANTLLILGCFESYDFNPKY